MNAPPLAQQIFTNANIAYLETFMTSDVVPGTRAFGDMIKSGKVIANSADEEMRKTLRDQQESQIAGMAAAAPPGVSDPAAFITQYRELIAKWQTIAKTDFGIQPESGDISAVVDGWYVDHDYVGFAKRIMDEADKARAAQ